mgnify:CR=1 FL=1
MNSKNNYKVINQYNEDDLIYIAYNNRSLTNVVYNFIPPFNVRELLSLKKY